MSVTSLALALGASNPSGGTALEATFIGRARAIAADEACDLFDENQRTALESGLSQARRDLRRAGYDGGDIEAALARVRTDRQLADCGSEGVLALAEDYRSAYAGYARQPSLNFEGPRRRWSADRTEYDFVHWPLMQKIDGGHFGRAVLSGPRDETRQVEPAVVLAGQSEAVSAMLVLRDPTKRAQAYDRTLGGLYALPDGEELARYSAPSHAERRIFASGRIDPAQARILNAGERGNDLPDAYGFRFPESALTALAALEPQEGAAIELVDNRGRVIDRVWVEAGQLQAALDFASMPYESITASR